MLSSVQSLVGLVTGQELQLAGPPQHITCKILAQMSQGIYRQWGS